MVLLHFTYLNLVFKVMYTALKAIYIWQLVLKMITTT